MRNIPGALAVLLALALSTFGPSVGQAADCVKSTSEQLQQLAATATNTVTSFVPKDVAARVRLHAPEILAGYHLTDNFVLGYFIRRVEPCLHKPRYPEVKDPEFLYRGLLITPDELAHILEHGQELSKTTWHAGARGISFSSNSTEAQSYIFQGGVSRPDAIGVVLKVRRTEDMKLMENPDLNSTRTIFQSDRDVPSEAIESVLIFGEHGMVELGTVFKEAETKSITPHERWTHSFDNLFRR